jgi:hypothetical protein
MIIRGNKSNWINPVFFDRENTMKYKPEGKRINMILP